MIRVLPDENLPRRLATHLDAAVVADAVTVAARGWAGVKNGELLRRAAAEFGVLLTLDRGIEHQQNLGGVDLCVIRLAAVSSKLVDLLPLVPELNRTLPHVVPGRVLHVPDEGAAVAG